MNAQIYHKLHNNVVELYIQSMVMLILLDKNTG